MKMKFNIGDTAYTRGWMGVRSLFIKSRWKESNGNPIYRTVGNDGITWDAAEQLLYTKEELVALRLINDR